jgi:hypothetical protein
MVRFETVNPCPAKDEISWAGVDPGLMTSWALAENWNKPLHSNTQMAISHIVDRFDLEGYFSISL